MCVWISFWPTPRPKDKSTRLICDGIVILAQGRVRDFLQLCGQSSLTTARVPSAVCQAWATQLLRGCAELHRQNCVHRDIKPDNVLVFLDGAQPPILKNADLGLAREIAEAPMTTEVGTPWYRAPDIFSSQHNGNPADVWSAGCTIVDQFSGYCLFPDGDNNAMEAARERVLNHHMLPQRHPECAMAATQKSGRGHRRAQPLPGTSAL